MSVCSCRHAETLPKVISSMSIPDNETIIFNWSIKYEKVMDKHNHDPVDTNNHWKLYLM